MQGLTAREEERIAPRLRVPVYVGTTDRSFVLGTLRNISMQGMFIQSTEPKEVGTSIDMRFRLPDQEEWIQVRAQVIWVIYPPAYSEQEPHSPSSRSVDDNPGMGLKILSIAPESQAFLEAFVHDHAIDQ